MSNANLINKLILGDCLEVMQEIDNKSVDLILCDLPYGTTNCKWDIIIPFEKLWEQYNRISKDNCAIVLFGGEPFSSYLRISNIDDYRYDWIWNKRKAANFLFGNKQPMKITENISVFYKKQPIYNPQKTEAVNKDICVGNLRRKPLDNSLQSEHFNELTNIGLKKTNYSKNYDPTKKLPENIIEFSKIRGSKNHPTEKPVSLCEYLIKTYTNEGDLILDNTMGSGTTCLAAKNLNRQFIGIEKEEKYFNIAKCSGGAISKHERFCTMNPNRGCRMCKHPIKPLSLINLLPNPKQFLKIEKEYNNEHYEGWKDTYKEPLENIKKECDYCPACILAVLRQSKVPLYMLDFDYKKEVEEWWKEKNEEDIKLSSFSY